MQSINLNDTQLHTMGDNFKTGTTWNDLRPLRCHRPRHTPPRHETDAYTATGRRGWCLGVQAVRRACRDWGYRTPMLMQIPFDAMCC